MTAFPKPKKGGRRREKARVLRRAVKVVKGVRPQVVERDGHCRLGGGPPIVALVTGRCKGASQWAHFGPHRRSRTVNRPPEERHTRPGSLMLCDGHHDAYDDGLLVITALTDRECDGPLEFRRKGGVLAYSEALV